MSKFSFSHGVFLRLVLETHENQGLFGKGLRDNPYPKRQILDSSKLKEFAHENFEFDQNIRKVSKTVGNTIGKGEIARYEQVFLFPQCFLKTCSADM